MQMGRNRRKIIIAQLGKRIHIGVAGSEQFLEHRRGVLGHGCERRADFSVVHARIVLLHHVALVAPLRGQCEAAIGVALRVSYGRER